MYISNVKEETSCPYWTLFEYGSCYAFIFQRILHKSSLFVFKISISF